MKPIAMVMMMLVSSIALGSERGEADAAYNAKQYAKCAELWKAIAAKATGDDAADAHYSTGCCLALDGKRDASFAALDRAVAAGFRDLANAKADTDLTSLHADARWPKLLDKIEARVAAWEKTLGDPALRREILAMVEIDQATRKAMIPDGFKDKAQVEKLQAIDRKNTARMKEIVAQKGWPTKSLVGKDGAFAAWLLVQHADLDVPFQKLCLAKMEPFVKTNEVEPKNWAYLVDRVAVAEKRKQVYGTQFTDSREPQPMEDPEHVDERRKSVGLGTLAEYKEQMIRMYGPPKPAATGAKPAGGASSPAK